MDFIWDTSILIHCIRKSASFEKWENEFGLRSSTNRSFISAVSLGEIYSIALQRDWGKSKIDRLQETIQQLNPLTIAKRSVISTYAKIDAYSQGKHPSQKLPEGISARNMGKNDLWIAATAHVIGANLVTSDEDFRHLDGVFLEIVWVE